MLRRFCHIRKVLGATALLVMLAVCCLFVGCAQEQEQPQQATEPEFKTELLESDTLKVFVPLDYPPFSSGSNEEPWGYDIAVAQEIADRLGVTVELIPTDRETILQELTGEFSLAALSPQNLSAPENGEGPSSSLDTGSGSATNQASSKSSTSVESDAATSTAQSAPMTIDGEEPASDQKTDAPEPKGDIAIAALAITDDRDEIVDFTTWYYVGNQAVVARDKTYASTTEFDPQKTRIAVVKGSTGKLTAENLTAEKLVVEYSTAQKCLQALEAKEVQAVVLDLPVAQYLINHEFPHDHIVERIMTGEAYGIAVPSESLYLKDAINEVLEEMEKDGTLERLENEHLKRSY